LELFKKEWLQLSGLSIEKKLKALKGPLKKWNKEGFEHIDLRIKSYQEEISKLDLKAQTQALQESDWLRRDALQIQLELWLNRKERFWKQVSRCKLLKEGDRNTKYFHVLASARRQRKFITKLLVEGNEVSEAPAIKKIIIAHFKQLYS